MSAKRKPASRKATASKRAPVRTPTRKPVKKLGRASVPKTIAPKGRSATRRKADAVAVRLATPLDLDEVVELRLALLREPSANPVQRLLHPDAARRARTLFAKQLRSHQEVTLLAEIGGAVVGILRCVAGAASPLHVEFRHAYMTSAYVTPSARKRGVLTALVSHALAWCEAHGVAEVRLHSAVGNAAAAAAWERLGFPVVEQLRRRPLTKH